MSSWGRLPPARPDQAWRPGPDRVIAPGGAGGTFRGRLVVIFGTGSNSGLFIYNGQPALGNPPIFAATTASLDPYGNVVTAKTVGLAGMQILMYSGAPALGNLALSVANAAGSDTFGNPYDSGVAIHGPGNSKNVLGWSTFVGSLPLLALFPDASWAYAGNSPFILSFDTNKGLASEYTALQLGSGNPPGGQDAQVVLYSASPDGTTSIPHMEIFGGALGNLIADFNSTGLIAADPNVANVGEAWHNISRGAGLSGRLRVKRLAQANLALLDCQVTSTAASTVTCGAMPAGYYPTVPYFFPTICGGLLGNVNVPTSGAIKIMSPARNITSVTCLIPLD